MKNTIFKTKRNRFLKEAGFTVIEMLVTIGVLTLLTSMVLVYSRQSESTSNLIREADRLIFEVNQAKDLSMLTLQQSTGTQPVCGWGIHFDGENSKSYTIFRDFCETGTSNTYDPGEEYETINLLKGVIIKSSNTSNISDVVFIPPEPRVNFNPPVSSGEAQIIICLEQKSDTCFTININSSGRVQKITTTGSTNVTSSSITTTTIIITTSITKTIPTTTITIPIITDTTAPSTPRE